MALLQASYVRHAYPPHSHDYYVIGLIERDNQSSFLKTRKRLEAAGIQLVTVEADELAKAEGAVTFCSLLFAI